MKIPQNASDVLSVRYSLISLIKYRILEINVGVSRACFDGIESLVNRQSYGFLKQRESIVHRIVVRLTASIPIHCFMYGIYDGIDVVKIYSYYNGPMSL